MKNRLIGKFYVERHHVGQIIDGDQSRVLVRYFDMAGDEQSSEKLVPLSDLHGIAFYQTYDEADLTRLVFSK